MIVRTGLMKELREVQKITYVGQPYGNSSVDSAKDDDENQVQGSCSEGGS